jgi:hypothetical protein
MKIPNSVNPQPTNPPVRPVTVAPRAPVAPTPVVQLPRTTPTPPGTRQKYEKLLERLSGEIWRLREKISGTRARANVGVGAKLLAATIEFKLDEDPYLFMGPGSFDDLLRSIHLDILALSAENIAAHAAIRRVHMEAMVSPAAA